MSLRERVLSGMIWTSAGTFLKYAFQLVVSVIVARIVSPTDYGLIAIVVSIHAIFQPLVLDIPAALIRQATLTREWLGTAFWLALALGAGVSVTLAALAPLMAAFYERPELTLVGVVLASGFSVGMLGAVPQAMLRRELRFREISAAEIASVLVSGVATVACAVSGFGLWALVLQGLLQSSTLALFLWILARFRPVLVFDRGIALSIFRFGAFGSAADFAVMTAASVSTMLVGRVLGATELGMYTRAMGLTQLVVSLVHGIVTQLMLPTLSQVQAEPERFRSVCLRATGLSALVLAPVLAAFVAVPDVVLELLYGPMWRGAVEPLRFLAITYLLFATQSAFTAIFPVRNRVDLALRWHFVTGVLMLVGTAIGVSFGSIRAVALGQMLVLLSIPLRIASAGALAGIRVRDYAGVIRAPLLAGLGTAIAVGIVRYALRDQAFPVLTAATVVAGVGTYAALTLGMRIEAVRSLRQFIGR